MRLRLVAALAALALAAPAAATLTACSPAPAHPIVYELDEWGPTVAGYRYCGYRYTPVECAGRIGEPVMYPIAPPIVFNPLNSAMWGFYLANDVFLNGAGYYDLVLAPIRTRDITVITVDRGRYVRDGRGWNDRYRSDHDRYVKQYPPKLRDHNRPGRVYQGDKYASDANKSADLVAKKTAKGGGNAKTVTDPGRTTTLTSNKRSSDRDSRRTSSSTGGVSRKR